MTCMFTLQLSKQNSKPWYVQTLNVETPLKNPLTIDH